MAPGLIAEGASVVSVSSYYLLRVVAYRLPYQQSQRPVRASRCYVLLWSYGQRRYKEVEGALQGSKCCTGAERHANRNTHGHADTGNINMEHQASASRAAIQRGVVQRHDHRSHDMTLPFQLPSTQCTLQYSWNCLHVTHTLHAHLFAPHSKKRVAVTRSRA